VGESHFILTGAEHLILEGLNFESTNGPAVELRGCSYVQITRNVFRLKETQRGLWIYIDGVKGDSVRLSHHNRIDHNLFEKKSQLGNFITIEGTMRAQPQVSQYDRIDHNLFADIGPRAENVLEAIRVGAAEYSLSSGYTIVENNLFERCDGDPEYISIKSSDDTIRNNTFRECLGSLSLRHGNRNTVEGNYIIGNGRTGTFLDSTGKTWTLGTGGVRFYGNGMRILNNYFEGLTGRRWDATFAITSGNAEYGDGQPLTKHFRIQDATIAGNTLVDNLSNFEIGYDGDGFQGNWWRLPPRGMRIENNVIVGSRDTLIKIFAQPEKSFWQKNIAWAVGAAVASRSSIEGVLIMDPHLMRSGGIWHRPDQPRLSKPLERKDVGPDAE
jgi:poly(beta-D-mannuronate) lyase